MLLASDWTNPVLPLDVDDSGLVTAGDALSVINWIARTDQADLPISHPSDSPRIDTNGDGKATALDALLVINALHRYPNDPMLVGNWAQEDDPNGSGVVLKDTVKFVGQSSQGVSVRLQDQDGRVVDATITADDGEFELAATVHAGTHDFDLVATDPLGRTIETTRRIRRGDVVMDWNATTLNVVREWTSTSDDPYQGRIVPSEPPKVARNLAMIHTAMFDAIATIEGGYETYMTGLTAPPSASSEAAAASAAFTVAIQLYPDTDSMGYWNATLEESLRSVGDGAQKQAGIDFGREVGLRMLESRLQPIAADENASDPLNPGLEREPGDWDRTFPGYLPPLLPNWMDVDPFVVDDIRDYRPAAPPELTSESYAQSVDQVMRLGGLNSEQRTDEQTEIAVFWADGGGTFTPPGHWNQIAADVMIQREHSLIENARVFALLNLALADAGIAAWDAKYHYDLWRPIDAIQLADGDGNTLTVQDADWRPLLISPPFPTYTSGHSTFSGAADAVLTNLLGDAVSFTSQVDGQTALGQRPLNPDLVVSRSFSSFSDAAEEAGLSRIYGGIHFDFDNTAGLQAGRDIGLATTQAVLRVSI